MRFFFILVLAWGGLLYAKAPLVLKTNGDGTQTLTLPLNYESQNVTHFMLRGARAEYALKLPIASRWVVLSAKLHLRYTPSLALIPQRSLMTVELNGESVVQQWLNVSDQGKVREIDVVLPPENFTPYTTLSLSANQHYTMTQCEDDTAPELWTNVDVAKSTLELTLLPKTLPASLSSIDQYLFDPKNVTAHAMTFVFPPKRSPMLAHSGVVVASAIGTKLKYRTARISVAATLPTNADAVVIATHQELKALLRSSFPTAPLGVDQVQKNGLVFIPNPINPQYGIIGITGEDETKVLQSAQAFATSAFTLYTGAGVLIDHLTLPQPSQPYSAPKYLPAGKKITFKELGTPTTSFKYMYPAPMEVNFKIYPDLFLDDKEKISIGVNGIYPSKVRFDSVLTIMVNDKFASQLSFEEKLSKAVGIAHFFNFKKSDDFSGYLISKGANRLTLQPSMVPFKKGLCELYNRENLQSTILNSSYIEFPEAPHWMEMPYIRYFIYGAYPFSIYPDGSHSAMVLDSFSDANLQGALSIGFMLGKEIGTPLYRIHVTTHPEEVKDKEIIAIGAYGHPMGKLLEKAQVNVIANRFTTAFPMGASFVDALPFFDSDRLHPFSGEERVGESSPSAKKMLLQLFQSPYDDTHSVVALQYDSPESMDKGIDLLFSPEQEIGWNSDTLIIDTDTQTIHSFELGKKYFVGDLSWWARIRYYLTASPVWFGVFALLFAFALAYVVRRMLQNFKRTHHPHV